MGHRLRLVKPAHLSISPSHAGQLSLLPLADGNDYQPKCGDALWLGRLISLVDKRVGA